jgi:hypothetical protein
MAFIAASAFCQFQIATRLEVQLHEARCAIGVDCGDLNQRGSLGVGEVSEQGPGRLYGHPLFRKAESVKRLHREVLQQILSCPLGLPEPRISAADCQTCRQPLLGERAIRLLVVCGKDDFHGAETEQFTASGGAHLVG